MKKINLASFMLLVSSNYAVADYALLCTREFVGGPNQEYLVVPGASDFWDACDKVENDPSYYEYGGCRDGAGEKGTCHNRPPRPRQ
jgi:hypothetical protein